MVMMMMARKLTRIIVDIEISRDLYDVPGSRLPIVGEVDVVLVVEKTQRNLPIKNLRGLFLNVAQILPSLSASSSS